MLHRLDMFYRRMTFASLNFYGKIPGLRGYIGWWRKRYENNFWRTTLILFVANLVTQMIVIRAVRKALEQYVDHVEGSTYQEMDEIYHQLTGETT